MDKEFREKLKDLRFRYKHQIGDGIVSSRGIKLRAKYKAERRRILKESRQSEVLYWLNGFNKWMNKRKESINNRDFYKRLYEESLKKKKPQSKLDKFISQKDE